MEHGAVGDVRWASVMPEMSVTRFSADPRNDAILRGNSILQSCAESDNRDISSEYCFKLMSLTQDNSRRGGRITVAREIGKKSAGFGHFSNCSGPNLREED